MSRKIYAWRLWEKREPYFVSQPEEGGAPSHKFEFRGKYPMVMYEDNTTVREIFLGLFSYPYDFKLTRQPK